MILASLIVNGIIALAAVVTAIATLNYARKTKELVDATGKMVEEQTRAARLTLQLEVQLRMAETWDGPRLKAARKRLAQPFTSMAQWGAVLGGKRTGPGIRDYLETCSPDEDVFDFFEDLGFYVRNGLEDVEMAENSFSFYCVRWWALGQGYVRKVRKQEGDSLIFSEFEGLAERFSRIEAAKRQPAAAALISDADLERFVFDELSLKVQGDKVGHSSDKP